jgi:hypothetical protein
MLPIGRDDLAVLRLLAASAEVPAYQSHRARVVLAVAARERTTAIAAREGCDTSTVWRICRRYERGGLSALLADGRRDRRSASSNHLPFPETIPGYAG